MADGIFDDRVALCVKFIEVLRHTKMLYAVVHVGIANDPTRQMIMDARKDFSHHLRAPFAGFDIKDFAMSVVQLTHDTSLSTGDHFVDGGVDDMSEIVVRLNVNRRIVDGTESQRQRATVKDVVEIEDIVWLI